MKRKICIIILMVGTIVGSFLGSTLFDFYPTFSTLTFTWDKILFYSMYVMLVMLPIVVELKERWQWRLLQSKI